jgi:hypothetical protein
VEGYGPDEGVVSEQRETSCKIVFLSSGKTITVSTEEAEEMIRASRNTRVNESGFGLDIASPNMSIDSRERPSSLDRSKEKVLLSQIEEWCNVPSKHPYRSDRDISQIDRANEKLKESLEKFNRKGKRKNSV